MMKRLVGVSLLISILLYLPYAPLILWNTPLVIEYFGQRVSFNGFLMAVLTGISALYYAGLVYVWKQLE